jgi:hypothetical protein
MREGSEAQRLKNLKDTPRKAGFDRDEFPPVIIVPDNGKRSVDYVRPSPNRSSGSVLRHELKDVPDGTRVRIELPSGQER